MRAQRLGNLQTVGLRGLAGKAISDGAFARRVYGGSAYEEADLRRVAAAVRGRDYPRSELVSVLRTQNESWGCTPETRKALRRLEEGALCVITGQQAGILTGPLYTVYKALSAVAWARALESLLGEAVVPVFWIAGDDHDYEEVARVEFPARTGSPHHVELPRSLVSGAPSARVAELRFVGEIAGWADQTVSLLPGGQGWDRAADAIREAFAPGATLVDAFARLMVTWLGHYGLIFSNPADRRFKGLLQPLFSRCSSDPVGFRDAFVEQSSRVRAEGYVPQIVTSPEATLFFWDDETGNRRRVDFTPTQGFFWREGATVHTIPEFEKIASMSPERISPNAAFRPVSGDSVFPTLVHVMGPGEIAYMAQVRALYDMSGVPMPLIAARAGFTVVPQEIESWLQSRSLAIEEALQPLDVWRHTLAEREKRSSLGGRIAETRRALDEAYEKLEHEVRNALPGMDTAVLSARIKTQGLMNKLEAKLDQGFRRRVRETMPELERISSFVFPGGVPQERVYSAAPFVARYGEAFFADLLSQIRPFDPVHTCMWGESFGLDDLPVS